jgi:hypothetical protein
VGLPPLLWSFPPTATFTSSPAPGCWAVPPLLPSLVACLFTVLWVVAPPTLQCSGHPTLFATCPFCCCCLFFSFFFFPCVGVSLSGGLCWSGPGLSVGVPCAT